MGPKVPHSEEVEILDTHIYLMEISRCLSENCHFLPHNLCNPQRCSLP